jgi:hypothetical protein
MKIKVGFWDRPSKYPEIPDLEIRAIGVTLKVAMVSFSKARRAEIHPGSSTARLDAPGCSTR